MQQLTGRPLTHESWVKELERSTEDVLAEDKTAYLRAAALPSPYDGSPVDLSMELEVKDGDTMIATSAGAGFVACAQSFEQYIRKRFFPADA